MSRRPEPDHVTGLMTRRRLLAAAGVVAAGGAAVGVGLEQAQGGRRPSPPLPKVPLGAQPAGLPERQHAWTATLPHDRDGNPVAPRFARLLFFDVVGTPTPAHLTVLEAALRTLERRFPWSPAGVLFTAGWGPGYFASRAGSDARRSRSRRDCRSSSCPRSTTTTSACTSPATTRTDWRPSKPRWCTAHRSQAPMVRSSSRPRCAGARPGPGSPAPACPQRTRTSGGSPPASRSPPPLRCSWASNPT